MIYLSIIIPVRNEERFIEETLTALAGQDYPKDRYELIVVDGMSTDATCSRVEKFIEEYPEINVVLLSNPGRLSSRARNIGIRAARGQLMGVIDGHVFIPNDKLFENMERLKEENQALCLARPAPLDVPGLTEGTAYWIAVARKSWLGHSRGSYIYSDAEGFVDPVSSGFAYDRSVFEQVGFFDESFDAAEDVEFHFRLKQAGIFAYTSLRFLIYSYPRDSLTTLFRQQARYGVGRARFVKKHRDGFTRETPIPALIFLFFAICPLVWISHKILPAFGFSYTLAMFLYWLILLGTGCKEAFARKHLLAGIIVSLAVWTTHMGLGWGFLKTVLLTKPADRHATATGQSTASDNKRGVSVTIGIRKGIPGAP